MRSVFRFCATSSAAALLVLGMIPALAAEKRRGEVSISGEVTFQGRPLKGGTVTFHPEKGKPVISRLAPDGTYSVKDVPVGRAQVTVETESVKEKPAPPPRKDRGDTPKERPTRYIPIPRKYAHPRTSGLVHEVKRGGQIFDIVLK